MAEIIKISGFQELYLKGNGRVRVIYTGLEEPHEIIYDAVNLLNRKDPNGPGIRAVIPYNITNRKSEDDVQQFDFECELVSRDNK